MMFQPESDQMSPVEPKVSVLTQSPPTTLSQRWLEPGVSDLPVILNVLTDALENKTKQNIYCPKLTFL